MEYLLHILILICIYSILSISLDLLVGHTGVLSITQAGFFGVGAYTSALLSVTFGISFLPSVLIAAVAAGCLSLLISLPSMRLHEDYFVIATFAFQLILFSLFNNWIALTRGPFGITAISRPIVFGWTIQSNASLLLLSLLFLALAYSTVTLLTTSPFGRVLRAIRGDEIFTMALGKDVMRFKVIAFAVSAALAASAGALYAHYMTYIDPSSFTVMESILVISMIVVGGAGSAWGPLVGAALLVTVPEVLRFIGIPSSIAANTRQIIYGALLIGILMFRPRGLVGKFGFGR